MHPLTAKQLISIGGHLLKIILLETLMGDDMKCYIYKCMRYKKYNAQITQT